MSELRLKIVDASFHRNGIGGVGFTAILFDDAANGRMIAALFDEPGYCAVFKVEELANENIAMAGGNSWRGDRFEQVLRPLLEKWEADNGTNRLGPFALPG